MELKITDEGLRSALSEAILTQIDAAARETLIREALKGILEKRAGQYGATKSSVVEEAFAQAVGRLTFDVIDNLVQNDPQVRTQIEDFAREAIAKTLVGVDRSKILDAFNSAFGKAISGDRY